MRRNGQIDAVVAMQLAMVVRVYERVRGHTVNVVAGVRLEIEGEISILEVTEVTVRVDGPG